MRLIIGLASLLKCDNYSFAWAVGHSDMPHQPAEGTTCGLGDGEEAALAFPFPLCFLLWAEGEGGVVGLPFPLRLTLSASVPRSLPGQAQMRMSMPSLPNCCSWGPKTSCSIRRRGGSRADEVAFRFLCKPVRSTQEL